MARTLILGASVAGLTVARELRRRGYAGEIVMVGEEPHLPYDRPPLSKQLLAGEWTEDRVRLCDASSLGAAGIVLRTGVAAAGLDLQAQTVTLSTGETLGYSELVIATGVRPRIPAAWARIDGVETLRTLADLRSVRALLPGAANVVIVGAGFIGSEAAAVLCAPGRSVTIVDSLSSPMAGALPPAVAACLARAHLTHGVHVRCGVAVGGIDDDDGRVAGVRLDDGTRLPADLVIVGLGSTANTGWLDGSGVPTADGVVCDAWCRAVDHVYAAGDVASWMNVRYGIRMRIEHRLHASEQATYVAHMIANGDATKPFTPIPFFWSDQFDLRLQAYGLVQADDEIEILEGALADRRFVARCVRERRVTGVLGVNMPREVRAARALIEASCPAPMLEPTA